MKTKQIWIEKQDVQRLSSEQLKALIDWKSHPGFKALKIIRDDALTRQMKSLIETDLSDEERKDIIDSMRYMSQAVEYLLDSTQRAKEELKTRD